MIDFLQGIYPYHTVIECMKVNCSKCNTELERSTNEVNRNKKGNFFCDRKCYSQFFNRYTVVKCVVCDKDFEKATADLNRYPVHCCSIECRAENNKRKEELPCGECGKLVERARSLFKGKQNIFCDKVCHDLFQDKKIDCICKECEKQFRLSPVYVERTQTDHNFCSTECRSKHRYKETFVEKEFSKMLDAAGIKHERNDRTIIKPLELDFWIPDLKVAIEINGPCHYQPIYGEDTLASQKARDKRKREACKALGIKLRVVKPADWRNGVCQRRFRAVIREIQNDKK